MSLLAQIPGADEAIQSASEAGWLAVLMTVVFLAVLLGFFLLGKLMLDQAQKREDRMAKRIDILEDQLHKLQEQYAGQLLEMSRQVTEAIVASKETQIQLTATISELTRTMGEVNGDIKEMCQLLSVCPCLFVGKHRGRYRLVDKATGDEVQFESVTDSL